VNQAVQNQPDGGLIIRDSYAAIPDWNWDSTQSTILGIPVLVDVNSTIDVIPDRSKIKPTLYLTFPNGWVLAINPIFPDLQDQFLEFPPMAFGTMYVGEANHVFDPKTVRSLQRNLADLAVLAATIREVASLPITSRDDLIPTYIDADPYRPGIADAILSDSGVHVWALMGAMLLANATQDEVAQDYELPREAMDAAIAYYRRFRPVILARIAANNVGTP
jgi:uncharacterized protein (DUF433 family)